MKPKALEPEPRMQIRSRDEAEAAMAIVRVLRASIGGLEERLNRQRIRLEGWLEREEPTRSQRVISLRHGWVGWRDQGAFYCEPLEGLGEGVKLAEVPEGGG